MSSSNPNAVLNAPSLNIDPNSIDLNHNSRALINAVQAATQAPARDYTKMRIFPMVVWTLNIQEHDGSGRDIGQILVESTTAGREKRYTTMKQTVGGETMVGEQLDMVSSINQMVDAMLLGYSEKQMQPADFQRELVGLYDDEEHGKPMLVVAALLKADLASASHDNLDRTKRGWDELLKVQVDGMSEDQFDPPILRTCILDAFAKL